jgi:hypothetical protein
MTVNRRTKVNNMGKEPFCEVDYDITGVTEFGSSFEELLMGKLKVPPEGFRADISFAGPIKGDIEGTVEGVDYLYTRADGRNELNVRAVITTKDGKNISFEADGISAPQPDGTFKLAENVKLFSSHPEYAKYNGMQVWGVGSAKGMKIEIKFYSAI